MVSFVNDNCIDELVHTKDDGKGEKTGAGLQSQDPAGQSQVCIRAFPCKRPMSTNY